MILLAGALAASARAVGALLPAYEFDAVEDLPAGGQGAFAIVLKDASDFVLARHAWNPVWSIPDLGVERDALSFAFRLLRPDALARIELEGPAGPLDSLALSPSRPQVSISAPSPGAPAPVEGGAVRVRWSGADADGAPLLYTVLYSANGGETWQDVIFETSETSGLVPIDPQAPADAHRILVRATDGGRSSDAVQSLHPASGGS